MANPQFLATLVISIPLAAITRSARPHRIVQKHEKKLLFDCSAIIELDYRIVVANEKG